MSFHDSDSGPNIRHSFCNSCYTIVPRSYDPDQCACGAVTWLGYDVFMSDDEAAEVASLEASLTDWPGE